MYNFFNFLKENFDLIIIDNAPSINIPDSLSLSKFSDLIVAVVMHKKSKPRDTDTLEKMFKGIGRPVDASIYNSFSKQLGAYYSDYYSYTYSYGYNYYNSDD